MSHPRGLHTRYFAEGVSSAFFDTTLRWEPLPGESARMVVRTLDERGLAASSCWHYGMTASLSFCGYEAARDQPSSFATIVESDRPFVAERTTTWPTWASGYPLGYGSHASEGLASLSTRWLFAEGVVGAFETYLALVNPSRQAANVTVTYLGADGITPRIRQHTVAPESRATILINDDLRGFASTDVGITLESSVPIAAERSVYFDAAGRRWGAGTSSVGASDAATGWFFAEGQTGAFFDTYLLLLNPSAAQADVEIEYLIAEGVPVRVSRTLSPQSRSTVHVNTSHVALSSASFGIAVRSTNGVPIVAERTMWWDGVGHGTRWAEGHTSLGATQPATRWFSPANGLFGAGGRAAAYLLIANPGDAPATVRISLPTAMQTAVQTPVQIAVQRVTVPPRSRFTLDLSNAFPVNEPGLGSFQMGHLSSVLVESLGDAPVPIVVERSTYADTLERIWEVGSNAFFTPIP